MIEGAFRDRKGSPLMVGDYVIEYFQSIEPEGIIEHKYKIEFGFYDSSYSGNGLFGIYLDPVDTTPDICDPVSIHDVKLSTLEKINNEETDYI